MFEQNTSDLHLEILTLYGLAVFGSQFAGFSGWFPDAGAHGTGHVSDWRLSKSFVCGGAGSLQTNDPRARAEFFNGSALCARCAERAHNAAGAAGPGPAPAGDATAAAVHGAAAMWKHLAPSGAALGSTGRKLIRAAAAPPAGARPSAGQEARRPAGTAHTPSARHAPAQPPPPPPPGRPTQAPPRKHAAGLASGAAALRGGTSEGGVLGAAAGAVAGGKGRAPVRQRPGAGALW